MKHESSGEYCQIHYPPCNKCKHCGRWIPYGHVEDECVKPRDFIFDNQHYGVIAVEKWKE